MQGLALCFAPTAFGYQRRQMAPLLAEHIQRHARLAVDRTVQIQHDHRYACGYRDMRLHPTLSVHLSLLCDVHDAQCGVPDVQHDVLYDALGALRDAPDEQHDAA